MRPRARLENVARQVAAGLDPDLIADQVERGQAQLRQTGDERAEVARCEASCLHWIETHVWLIDPKAPPETQKPFPIGKLWPRQQDYVGFLLDGYELGRNRTVVKSREVGASWLAMAVLRWLWWRYPDVPMLAFSAREDKVDDKTPDSLLGKVRFIDDHLPSYLRDPFDRDKLLLIENGRNGSVIKGQSTSAKLGRGGRYAVVFGDEWAHVDRSLQRPIVLALTSTTRSWWRVSTGNGPADDFAFTLKNAADEDKLKLDFYTDPRRTEQDYENLLIQNGGELTEEERAQEYGCSLISVSGLRIFRVPIGKNEEPRFQYRRLHARRRPKLFTLIAMDFGSGPSWTVALWLVVDLNDWKRLGKKRRFWRVYVDREMVWTRTPAHEIGPAIVEVHKAGGYNPQTPIVGDPSGVSVDAAQESWESRLRASGLPIRCLPMECNEKETLDASLRDLQVGLDLDMIHVDPVRAPITGQSLQLWEWNVPKGIDVKLVSRASIEPRKDGYSHPGNALQYGWMGIQRLAVRRSVAEISKLTQPVQGPLQPPEPGRKSPGIVEVQVEPAGDVTVAELYGDLLSGGMP